MKSNLKQFPSTTAPDPRGVSLDVEAVQKSYGARAVLRGLDLEIDAGEFVAIVGRSGCGKSTLLRLIAGLENLDQGRIRFDGAPQEGMYPEARIMFQDARLLPWRCVLANAAIGLPKHHLPAARRILDQVGLAGRQDDWPGQLSGGQRQRVALARALAHRPRLLLLDEPLGALDALTRIEMQELIESLWHIHRFTALLVTHDVQEAIALADRLVLIEDGAVTFEKWVNLPRPRARGSAGFAALEQRVLRRILGRPARQPAPLEESLESQDLYCWRS